MKKRPPSTDKLETLRRLSLAVFALEASKGHLAWKVTDLVRKSGYSRALIYRYLGNSKPQMLNSIVRSFINEFYGFDSPYSGLPVSEQVGLARQLMTAYPEAVVFYQKWRSKESLMQKEFMAIEERFQKKLADLYPGLSRTEILARHAMIHGLVSAPFLTPEQAKEIYKSLYE